jgi:hypothetical protein
MRFPFRRTIFLLASVSIVVSLVACGGSGSSSSGGSGSGGNTTTYTIGGTVSGLSGTGLVLQNNGGNNLSVTANGSFTFSTSIASGGAYDVSVLTEPTSPAQTCAVTGGSGTATANVTNVQVTCSTTPTYTIGGTVSGLSGTGLVLQNNGGNNLSITANGSFTFSTAITSGSTYDVTILTQPSSPAQTCAVSNGSGTASANVTSVQVACTTIIPTYTIGGTVSGLSGTGLVLQDNGGNNLSITADGAFTFSTAITSGSTYDVTVLTQPSDPTQTCAVTNGSGTAGANVTSVQVTCTTTTTYTIGGTVSGLSGTGLVLQNNGGDNLSVTMDGDFTFSMAVASDSKYDVTVLTQPSNPAQTCAVTDGSETATADVTNVDVTCTNLAPGEWTWIAGQDTFNNPGVYGTEGTAAPDNTPGSRDYSLSWTDTSGDLWLFGGVGRDSTGTFGGLNDLWKFSGGQWTWVSGSDVEGESGSYGTQGTASSSNVPGQRNSPAGWTDAAGNLWLFGGIEYTLLNTYVYNDLWKYSGGEWTWVSGSSSFNQKGTYGTEGTAAAGNIPGARNSAVSWVDASGDFWLFGGQGLDSTGLYGELNDLWKYSGGEWTWMGGSNLAGQKGTYGTLGTAAAGNVPGGRSEACTSTDKAGNLWLFGGSGFDSTGTNGYLNDLWKYSAGKWTWVSGSNLASQYGTYGTLGTPAATNVPGSRGGAACWIDGAGNFWLYAGIGAAASGNTAYFLGDLWEYSAGEWTWMGGPNLVGQPGDYGTLGKPAASNLPGTRHPAASWVDPSGNFWTFGGLGYGTTPNVASNLNDLWEYVP